MISPSSFTRLLTLLLALACIGCTGALDIALDSITCDQSLPAYASTDDVRMTCNDGKSSRCSFGQDVMIRGTLQYRSLGEYSNNGTGYASSNLRLLSVEYNLFEQFPIDFCGDWIESHSTTDNGMVCPNLDDFYYFNVPYTLPMNDDDMTMWFATGWQGVSTLQVRNGNSDDSALLTDCELRWHTYVTPSEEDGWKTMPSAAQTGIVLASVLTAILCCCTYAICCRRRNKHVTDVGYYDDFSDYEIHDEKKKICKNDKRIDRVEALRN